MEHWRVSATKSSASSLGLELDLEDITESDLYKALDWLGERQARIETKLAKKHLESGTLVLYDVSSSYYTGRNCPLAKHGYSRDGKKGLPQVVYGLLCNSEGCPVAVEVFSGNTSDPKTISTQIKKLRERLIQLSFFDEKDLVEISSEDFAGERLGVCRNPLLAEERCRKRSELLAATEKKLEEVVTATKREKRALRGKDKFGLRVGRLLNKYKMAKHFLLEIGETEFSFRRDEEKIAAEAALTRRTTRSTARLPTGVFEPISELPTNQMISRGSRSRLETPTFTSRPSSRTSRLRRTAR